MQEQLKTAEYGVVTASLSHDFREAVSFNLRKHKVRTKCRQHPSIKKEIFFV